MTTTSNQNLREMKAVLLVGGLGTRLRAVVPSTPKPLAAVGGRSFLELLVQQLQHQGIRNLLMCTGYLGEQVRHAFGDGSSWGTVIEYSQETSPMGTAGAIKLAEPYLGDAAEFMVLNGDSFLEMNFERLLRFHRSHEGILSMAVLETEDASRYGTVNMTNTGRVTGFSEKAGNATPGIVNAGIYIFDRAVLEHIPEGPTSLEKDIFPQILDRGVYALEQQGMFIDIGTPDDYARAQQLHSRLHASALQ